MTKIEIEGIRGFGSGQRRLNLDLGRPRGASPAGWTVIAGRNGSGKTTFLRSLALAIAGPSAARALQESFAGWIREGNSVGHVVVQLAYDNKIDRFEKTGRLPADAFWTGLQWALTAGAEPSLSEYSLNKTMRQTPGRGPWADAPRGWFVAGYGPFRRLTGHASDAQRLMVGPNNLPRLVSLFREDASLLECVQWLKDIYLRRLEGKVGAKRLEEDTLALLNDDMLPDGVKVQRVDSDGLWINQSNVILALKDLSDGYRTTIALILDIIRHMYSCFGDLSVKKREDGSVYVDNPGVVIIDEVDVHLHVSWQQRIGFWLKRRFPKVQFIVSSHSPFICQAADPGGLIRLPAPGENRTAEIVDEELHKRIIRGTADETVMTDLFGLDDTRSLETQQMFAEFAELEVRKHQTRLTPQQNTRLRFLQLELPLSPTNEVQKALDQLRASLKDEANS